MNKKNIIVFDFETGGLDTATLEPVQIAAAVLDPRTLEIIDEFASLMRPVDMNNLSDKALEVNGKTREELAVAPEQEHVWRLFCNFVGKYGGGKKSSYTAPIAAGKNIYSFDLLIAQRLCTTYKIAVDKGGRMTLFDQRRFIDLEDFLFHWWENSVELPSEKMDDLRSFFGLSIEGAHDALVDVRQTAHLIVKFLRLNRSLKPKITFRGACSGGTL